MADAPSGAEVLGALDKLLQDRPNRVTHDFSAVTERLTAYRRAVLAQWDGAQPDAAGRQRLARLNAVISIVYGTHYPIGSPKWEPLEAARNDFAALVRELGR